MTMRIASCFVLCAALTACATQPPMEWVQTRAGGMDLAEATARCDYETSMATQGTDYRYRTGLVQEIDRAMRKSDLERKCMAANGFAQRLVVSPEQAARNQNAPYDQLQAAIKNRNLTRASLTAEPRSSNASTWSAQIADLNIKVHALERQLGYPPSEPVSTDPEVAWVAGSK